MLADEQQKFLIPFILTIFPQQSSNQFSDVQQNSGHQTFDNIFTDTESYNFYVSGFKDRPAIEKYDQTI